MHEVIIKDKQNILLKIIRLKRYQKLPMRNVASIVVILLQLGIIKFSVIKKAINLFVVQTHRIMMEQ